ncbi:uncharacterized protein B0I36DRAFT_318333 [Microdochium trichocladiopsis]|uniref:Secreted protein n=1 Tax=Microdochium trichocladiopsis TaxID=1682393 RepID=A0A9P8YEE2_9PEZI|nr:uncharacterized protein B0I36DRAFT_318333 [Microdochium trichocladiopsis]KAH7035427.1 hypothetical protein B0I36DRAFT_318333 [Microdochium trichocladiopsis]
MVQSCWAHPLGPLKFVALLAAPAGLQCCVKEVFACLIGSDVACMGRATRRSSLLSRRPMLFECGWDALTANWRACLLVRCSKQNMFLLPCHARHSQLVSRGETFCCCLDASVQTWTVIHAFYQGARYRPSQSVVYVANAVDAAQE